MLAVLFLTACNTDARPVQRLATLHDPLRAHEVTALPEDLHRQMLDIAFARQIASSCAGLALRQQAVHAQSEAMRDALTARGYTGRTILNINRHRDTDRIQAEFLNWMHRRGVEPDRPQTLCDAGRAEVVEGTAIGQYLRET